MSESNTAVSLHDLDDTFDALSTLFKSSGNSWRLAQSLDTILDYFMLNPSKAKAFIPIILDRYHDYYIDPNANELGGNASYQQSYPTTAQSCWWYDDYNWWTIAMLKASSMEEAFGKEYTAVFAGISRFCWDTVFRNGTQVWRNSKTLYGDYFDRFKPRFEGGVWNYPYSKDPIQFVPDTPLDPNPNLDQHLGIKTDVLALPDKLRGIQNTVTNALNLIASARMAEKMEASNNPNILTTATNQLSFLLKWFAVKDKSLSLYCRFDENDTGLARERVSSYKILNYPVHAYDENLIWLGDQGLVLGGYAEMLSHLEKDSADCKSCMAYIEGIIKGVNDKLANNSQLYPWFHLDSNSLGDSPGGDDADYLTGLGIYFRYLLNLYENYPAIKSFMDEQGIPKISVINVNNYYCNIDNYPNDEGAHFTVLTNKLAVQLAAYKMNQG